MTEQFLVAFDTDRIKDYIFATEKLREIRGASRLLDELNHKKLSALISKDYEPIFFGGGSGAVLAPSKEAADRLIKEVENLYRTETVTASISGAYIPINPDTDNFGEKMKAAGFRLRRIKDEKAARVIVAGEAFTQPCASCQRYPATGVDKDDNAPLCLSCIKKRDVEKQRKQDPQSKQLVENLEKLGELSHVSDYVGFIYADGNNMGELLTEFSDQEQYGRLAKGLKELVENAVEQSLKNHSNNNAVQRHDVFLAGGDDLMIVTTGDIALPTAVDIAKRFEEGSARLLSDLGRPDKKCFLSVAAVLAHATFPIAAFRSLAEQLLKNAKRKCAEENYKTSAIDFMVVTSAGSSDVATLRDEVLSEKSFVFPHGDRKIRLTQRPYTLGDMERLVNHVRAFNDIPQSQLQFLYEGLFHSQAEAIYRWGKVAGRTKKENRQAMDEFYKEFGEGEGGLPPWQQHLDKVPEGIEATSALGDLIEIYRFVQRRDT